MPKFKVGDKVRGTRNGCGISSELMTLAEVVGVTNIPFNRLGCDMEIKILDHANKSFNGITRYVASNEYVIVEQPRREFIVIHRSGNVMTAEHRVNREVIRSAKATCNPSDTFDFNTGAKLAFDRLMGSEEPKPEPKPAHKFRVGDRVVTKHGSGTVMAIKGTPPILVLHDNWKSGHDAGGTCPDFHFSGSRCWWFYASEIKPLTGESNVR